MQISREKYASLYGPTSGDQVRLADTDLFAKVEKDYTHYGDEVVFGGGKVIRDGMGQNGRLTRDEGPVDTVITNAIIVDYTGIYKADVAIKDGGNGAWVADKTTREKLPPYPCKPIEPIGAGDGFNAGFLAGILQGRDVVTAGRMGAICGALATQTPGDVEGYPDAAQMEAALTGAAITYR